MSPDLRSTPSSELLGGYRTPDIEGMARPALLVVDMTNDFGHPDGVYARNGAVTRFDEIVPRIRDLMLAGERLDIPSIATNQVIYEGTDGRAMAADGLVRARPWLADEGLRPGTWGVEVIGALPRPRLVLSKPRASAFFATPLDLILRSLKVDTVVVTGAYTNQCIAATVRDAWALDYRVVLPTDAVTAFDPQLHQATLESLRPLSTQASTREVVTYLRRLGATDG